MTIPNEAILGAIFALWQLVVWFIKKKGVNTDPLIVAMHKVITAETETGSKKVWSPSKPIEELMEAVEAIDVGKLNRTHENSTLIHEQLTEVIHTLNDIVRKVDK